MEPHGVVCLVLVLSIAVLVLVLDSLAGRAVPIATSPVTDLASKN